MDPNRVRQLEEHIGAAIAEELKRHEGTYVAPCTSRRIPRLTTIRRSELGSGVATWGGGLSGGPRRLGAGGSGP